MSVKEKRVLTGYPSIDKLHEKGYSFFDKHPLIPNMSFYNSLCLMSTFYRKENAVDCLDLSVTYDELIDNAAILSRAFKELGIKSGDIITVSMPNFYQAVAVFLAANRIGAITTFLNSSSSIKEIEDYLNLFESPLFIDYDKDMEYNQKIKSNTSVRQIITLSKSDLNSKKFNVSTDKILGYDDFLSFNDMGLLADFYKKNFKTLFGGNQDALILYTSGSTGYPKSVVMTNQNILASGIYMKNTGHVKSILGEKCLICVPFSYPYGFVTSTLMSLLCGRNTILGPNISKENVEYFLRKEPNYVFGSPAFLELIKRNIPNDMDLSSVHSFISGGDFLTVSQYLDGKDFFAKHNSKAEIFNGSGNAETGGANTIAVGSKVRPETVGKILIGSDAIIIDPETGTELKYGEEGVLCISGKHVFKEYYDQPKMTEDTKCEFKGKQYYKTGTMGILDEDGYFKLTGRASRFYIRSDLNKVYCEYVQKIISMIDVVKACVVVPKPDKDFLYVSKAYIILKDGIEPTEKIRNYIFDCCGKQLCNSITDEHFQLKSYEIPESIDFLVEFPKTSADKVDYSKLEEMAKSNNESYKKELKR